MTADAAPKEPLFRVVCLSDTHGKHGLLDVPDGDLLIHCGDMTKHGTAAEVGEFNDWLGTLPHRWKVLVAGNHDEAFQYEPERARALVTNAVYLQDSETTAGGFRIWGSPWQPAFNDWFFNLPRGAPLKEKWDLIPQGIDILVTHGPPHGILDEVSSGLRVGCEDLLAAVRRVRPRLHVFGHIHSSPGKVVREGIVFGNAAICDDSYRAARKPLLLKL